MIKLLKKSLVLLAVTLPFYGLNLNAVVSKDIAKNYIAAIEEAVQVLSNRVQNTIDDVDSLKAKDFSSDPLNEDRVTELTALKGTVENMFFQFNSKHDALLANFEEAE